jgi:hypothetical protein
MPDIRDLLPLIQDALSGTGSLVPLVVILIVIAGFWKTLNKASLPPWGALVPIYNVILIADIAGRPMWWAILWFVLLFVPIIGWIIAAIIWFIFMHDISTRFGKGIIFALGLFFLPPVFFVILGFGGSEYR